MQTRGGRGRSGKWEVGIMEVERGKGLGKASRSVG